MCVCLSVCLSTCLSVCPSREHFSVGCSASKWHHKVTCGGRAERSAIRASRSKDKVLHKIIRRISEDTVPYDRGDPIMDALLSWEPVKHVHHVVGDMTKPRHTVYVTL